jgi:hypothetical protein
LQSQVEDLRDRSEANNGIAISNLIQIIADRSATLRQKVKACALLLSYKSDHDTNAFARAFLEKAVSDPDTPIDYKLEGLEQLRRAQGDPQLRPTIEKLTPPSPPRDEEAEEAERRIEFEKKKRHCEMQAAEDQQRMAEEREQMAARAQRTNKPRLIFP